MRRGWAPLLLFATAALAGGAAPADPRARLAAAKREAAIADARADALARDAATERTRAGEARMRERSLAARVEASEAQLAAARTRAGIVAALLADRRAALGEQQTPVAQLLAALQSLARRPAAAAIAQPGSVEDMVRLRAVLGSALPLVQARTAALRSEVAATRRLQADAALAAAALRTGRARLIADRTALARLEADHRARANALGRDAMSESDRALALGERARDLVDRLAEDDLASATGTDLAALPGPVPRPLAPGSVPPPRAAGVYRLPVAGRLVTGLGEVSAAGVRARGLTFAVAANAPVVAPAAGIVRYARRFRGYGDIVIIDHGDGWTSLLTGLAETSVLAGSRVAMGDPVGTAARGEDPRVTVELRRRGRPVDIAALVG